MAGGQYARNIGVKLSKGEYIQFFDDDDLMLPTHIEKKVAILKEKEIDYVTCNFNYFEGLPECIVGEKCLDNIVHTIEGHLLTSSFPAPAFMCSRACISEIGYWNERLLRFQDIGYFHRLFLKDKRGEFLSEKLFLVRKHAKSISANHSRLFHQSMYDAFEAVKEEWRIAGRENKMLRRVFLLLQTCICLQAMRHGSKWWGIKRILALGVAYPCGALWLIGFVSRKLMYRIGGKEFSSYSYIIGSGIPK